jgi:hypothetical protein
LNLWPITAEPSAVRRRVDDDSHRLRLTEHTTGIKRWRRGGPAPGREGGC